MRFTNISGILLLIAASAMASPISASPFVAPTEAIEVLRAALATNSITDIIAAEEAIKALKTIMASNTTAFDVGIKAAATPSSDLTSDSGSDSESEAEHPITKRWGKNAFKDCTDEYKCVDECSWGSPHCWKECHGDPLYPDCATYKQRKIEDWKNNQNGDDYLQRLQKEKDKYADQRLREDRKKAKDNQERWENFFKCVIAGGSPC